MLHTLMMMSLFAGLFEPAGSKPVSLSAGDPDGAVVLVVDPVRAIQSPTTFSVEMGAYDPQRQVFVTGSFGGWANIENIPIQAARPRVFALKVRPGVYGIMAVRAGPFGACYNASSVSFEVKPGVVTVVGELDPNPALVAYVRAASRGEVRKTENANYPIYVFDIAEPKLTAANVSPYVENVVSQAVPGLVAPMVAAKLTPISFKTGHYAFSGPRLCAGYGADKSPVPPPPKLAATAEPTAVSAQSSGPSFSEPALTWSRSAAAGDRYAAPASAPMTSNRVINLTVSRDGSVTYTRERANP